MKKKFFLLVAFIFVMSIPLSFANGQESLSKLLSTDIDLNQEKNIEYVDGFKVVDTIEILNEDKFEAIQPRGGTFSYDTVLRKTKTIFKAGITILTVRTDFHCTVYRNESNITINDVPRIKIEVGGGDFYDEDFDITRENGSKYRPAKATVDFKLNKQISLPYVGIVNANEKIYFDYKIYPNKNIDVRVD